MFPVLFEIVVDKNASVESLLVRQVEGRSRNWHVEFIRNFNDWEIDEVASFVHLLDSSTPLGEGNDRMIRKLINNEEFAMQSFYEKIARLNTFAFSLEGHMEDQGTSESFILCVDSDWGKILTCENLIKKCFSMVCRCCMCYCSREIVDHLLIHCSMAFELWNFIFRMFGV